MSFWYLASPYSKYPGGMDLAFQMACRNAALLLKAGIPVFSPIAHSHPIAVYGDIEATSHEFWIDFVDMPFMEAARGCIVLQARSWTSSTGVAREIEYFNSVGKPVATMKPGRVPPSLLPTPSLL